MPTIGSTSERGYGADHRHERERWARVVATGTAQCANPVCLRPNRRIAPDEPWDLGHDDDRGKWRGAEHRACNRSEGGRNGAVVANARNATTIRAWGSR